MSARLCDHAPSKWVGIVTNQDPRIGWDRSRPHCSVSVCGREFCQRNAMRYVAGETNEVAVLYLYADIRAARVEAKS